MQKHLHIISFDIPFPANYGGVIDVYHKIRCLHASGIKIILHCFEYGNRKQSPELEKICFKVYYYKRHTHFINHFTILPFNVKSRISKELKQNLLRDDYPILFEVLHSCYLLKDEALKDRIKLFRHSNIEHHYFFELAKSEKSFLKKMYLYVEAFKLKHFEKIITNANGILAVSKTDLNYFKKTYEKIPSYYLPSFHQHDEVKIKSGKGDYILYHGNLSISENYDAAEWLIKNVFSQINQKVIIAGLNPPSFLTDLIAQYSNISLIINCSSIEMNDLISHAQIHCIYTSQESGLKLKLLNILYSGRHILANDKILNGTDLDSCCQICNTPAEYIAAINLLMDKEYSSNFINQRKKDLFQFNNLQKTNYLIGLL